MVPAQKKQGLSNRVTVYPNFLQNPLDHSISQVTMAPKDKYTDPKLRDEIKEEIHQGDKGGKPGQWSARKVIPHFPFASTSPSRPLFPLKRIPY